MPKTKPEPARLGVDPTRLHPSRAAKEKSLRIRVSQGEHDEMMAVAASHGLTVSEYIRQLHRQAATVLKDRRAEE